MERWKVIDRVYDRLYDENAQYLKAMPGLEYIWINGTLIDIDRQLELADYFVDHNYVDPDKEDLDEVVYWVCRNVKRMAREIIPPRDCINGIMAPKINKGTRITRKLREQAYLFVRTLMEYIEAV